MSILQIEIPDEKRAQWEERARARGRDLQTWALEQLDAPEHEETDAAERGWEEQKLLEALDSGPGQVVDDAWWDAEIARLNHELDARNAA